MYTKSTIGGKNFLMCFFIAVAIFFPDRLTAPLAQEAASARAVDQASQVSRSRIGYGLTKTINLPSPASFTLGENSIIAAGLYRKYTTAPGYSSRQAGYQYAFEITADSPKISSSANGLSVLGQFHGATSPTHFAYHNIMSIVESDAPNPSEPTAAYFTTQAINGGSPWGLIVSSYASGSARPNHVYGQQIVVGHDPGAQPIVSQKALSIWSVNGLTEYGNIIWGTGGFKYGNLVTNMSDRNENEIPHGGEITYAHAAVGSDRGWWAPYSDGSSLIEPGNTVKGAESGSSAVISHVTLESGSWAAGTAAGKIYCNIGSGPSGAFKPDEALLVNGAKIAKIPADFVATKIANGLYLRNLVNGIRFDGSGSNADIVSNANIKMKFENNSALCLTDGKGKTNAAIYAAGLSLQKGTTYGSITTWASGITAPSAAYASVFRTATDGEGTQITDIIDSSGVQIIYIIGGGGTKPSVLKKGAKLAISRDWIGLTADTITLLKDTGTGSWVELGRSSNQ